MDSAEAGADLGVEYPGGGMPAQASVPLPAGRWRARATQTWVDPTATPSVVTPAPACSSPACTLRHCSTTCWATSKWGGGGG
ncbi:hypothetical protein ACFV9E_40600 [Streptomyces sp. NPDC059835]|uniref:hypothetical protein n=1 Tax=Streptomyces sp. NPDC059835 TaxID=3346967 RepID=UPI00364B9B24